MCDKTRRFGQPVGQNTRRYRPLETTYSDAVKPQKHKQQQQHVQPPQQQALVEAVAGNAGDAGRAGVTVAVATAGAAEGAGLGDGAEGEGTAVAAGGTLAAKRVRARPERYGEKYADASGYGGMSGGRGGQGRGGGAKRQRVVSANEGGGEGSGAGEARATGALAPESAVVRVAINRGKEFGSGATATNDGVGVAGVVGARASGGTGGGRQSSPSLNEQEGAGDDELDPDLDDDDEDDDDESEPWLPDPDEMESDESPVVSDATEQQRSATPMVDVEMGNGGRRVGVGVGLDQRRGGGTSPLGMVPVVAAGVPRVPHINAGPSYSTVAAVAAGFGSAATATTSAGGVSGRGIRGVGVGARTSNRSSVYSVIGGPSSTAANHVMLHSRPGNVVNSGGIVGAAHADSARFGYPLPPGLPQGHFGGGIVNANAASNSTGANNNAQSQATLPPPPVDDAVGTIDLSMLSSDNEDEGRASGGMPRKYQHPKLPGVAAVATAAARQSGHGGASRGNALDLTLSSDDEVGRGNRRANMVDGEGRRNSSSQHGAVGGWRRLEGTLKNQGGDRGYGAIASDTVLQALGPIPEGVGNRSMERSLAERGSGAVGVGGYGHHTGDGDGVGKPLHLVGNAPELNARSGNHGRGGYLGGRVEHREELSSRVGVARTDLDNKNGGRGVTAASGSGSGIGGRTHFGHDSCCAHEERGHHNGDDARRGYASAINSGGGEREAGNAHVLRRGSVGGESAYKGKGPVREGQLEVHRQEVREGHFLFLRLFLVSFDIALVVIRAYLSEVLEDHFFIFVRFFSLETVKSSAATVGSKFRVGLLVGRPELW